MACSSESEHHLEISDEEDESDGLLVFDAIHNRFQLPMVKCLDCRQLVKEKDLGDHYLEACGEGCGQGCCRQKCKGRYKGNCMRCGDFVYPFLTGGNEILFSHSCTKAFSRRGMKYICAACSKPHDSRKALERHMGTGCFQKCPECNCKMFTKQSVFGIKVDHVCHTL